MKGTSHAHDRRGRIALFAVAAFFLLGGIADTDLWAPDEPRFGAVVQEMQRLERGVLDLVVLRLSGEVYTQKPPLFYWIAAAIGTLSGEVSEVSVRLPSALAGIGCIALCLALGRRLFGDPQVGLLAGAILLSVHQFGHLARRAQLDVILTLFVGLAVLAYWQLQSSAPRDRRWLFVLHISLGLGLLTKGPVALLPILIIAIHLVWEGRLASFRGCFPIWGILVMLGPVLIWVSLATLLAPAGFFQTAVIDNVWGRFANGTAHIRPVYYYLYHFPIEFMPWTLMWPAAALFTHRTLKDPSPEASGHDARPALRLLLVWIATYFIVFTISSGKRGLYLLPCFPAVAVLCGAALHQGLTQRTSLPRPVAAALMLSSLAAGGFGAWLFASGGLELSHFPGFALPPLFGGLLLATLIICSFSYLVLGRMEASLRLRCAVIIATVLTIEALVFRIAYPAFNLEKSPRPIAEAAREITPAGQRIGVFDQRDLIGGIVFYAGRRVTELRSPDDVHAFFDAGGRSMIVRAEKLNRTGRADRLHVHHSTRSGNRRLLLLTPSGGS